MHRVGRPGSDEQFRRHRRSHNFETHRQAGAVLALSDVKCCPGYSVPNNAGRFDNTFGPEHATGSDAIYVIGPGVTHVSVNSDGEYPNWAIGFNASKSNPIYGRSETVQPASMRTLALIRAY